jgi:hypothetical protein
VRDRKKIAEKRGEGSYLQLKYSARICRKKRGGEECEAFLKKIIICNFKERVLCIFLISEMPDRYPELFTGHFSGEYGRKLSVVLISSAPH